jgi:hypothetical protein
MVSTLQQSIEFMKDFGMFDVVLPFLLVFAIIFAILEKTFILGKESDGAPKKNLNSIVAFVIAMLAVATNKVVSALNEALPNVVLLIIVSVSFLMMIGVFLKTGELDLHDKHKGWYTLFTILMFIGLLAIFASAIKFEGVSALSLLFNKLGSFTEPIFGTVLFLIVIGAVLYFIIKGGKK